MIDRQLVETIVTEKLIGTDCFLVDVSVSSDNVIVVEIDNETGIDIDFCVYFTDRMVPVTTFPFTSSRLIHLGAAT